jgi:hypothetical protein
VNNHIRHALVIQSNISATSITGNSMAIFIIAILGKVPKTIANTVKAFYNQDRTQEEYLAH